MEGKIFSNQTILKKKIKEGRWWLVRKKDRIDKLIKKSGKAVTRIRNIRNSDDTLYPFIDT